MRIDPGMCPLCGNPICTNIPFVCSEICIHHFGSGCYQLGGNPNDYGTCECLYDDLMEFYDETFKENNLFAKKYEIAELIIAKLQSNGKMLQILPDKLFEL
jgi:hypothetical protein